jgi:hypothetical protein
MDSRSRPRPPICCGADARGDERPRCAPQQHSSCCAGRGSTSSLTRVSRRDLAKRRRYRELPNAAIGDSAFPRFELDDPSRDALARWRAPVTVSGIDQELSVDDPTDPALEPDLREFELGGDVPADTADGEPSAPLLPCVISTDSCRSFECPSLNRPQSSGRDRRRRQSPRPTGAQGGRLIDLPATCGTGFVHVELLRASARRCENGPLGWLSSGRFSGDDRP